MEERMPRFGLYSKLMTRPGQRDALVALLLEAMRGSAAMPGCELYIVNTSPIEADAVWVTEVWRSREDHAASLTLPPVQAIIARAMPLLTGVSERIEVAPVGGKGLAEA
jgi:quinol monooxygenase YgiN